MKGLDVTTIQEGHDYVQYLMEKSGVEPQSYSETASFKRVIDGKTYNISTSTTLAKWSFSETDDRSHLWSITKETTDPSVGPEILHQTKSGDLFFWMMKPTGRWIFPVTMGEAIQWARLRNLENEINESLGLSTTDIVPASVNLRLPPSLLLRITGLALMAGMSRNEWIMRCLEEAANSQGKPDQEPPPGT